MRKQLGAMPPFALLECQEGHVPAPSFQPLSHGVSLGTWIGFWRAPETQAIDFIGSHLVCVFSVFGQRGLHTSSPWPHLASHYGCLTI